MCKYFLSSGERTGKSPNSDFIGGLQGDDVGGIPNRWEYFRGRILRQGLVSRNTLERGTIEGNSPVDENHFVLLVVFLKYSGKRLSWRKQAVLSAKAKYVGLTDSELVP